MKDKTTAGILALFVGGIGIHKFYLEQTGAGIIYLIFCWTFIPSFVAFIEGIIYLTMSAESFDTRFNFNQIAAGPPASQHVVIHNHIDATSGQAGQSAGPSMPAQPRPPSISDELKKLHELHLAGVLTREEFAAHKQRLLS